MNLFKTLMPSRPGAMSTSRQPRSFGREDYVTAAVALVLQADVEAGGSLTERVLGELYGVALHGRPRVLAQAEHPDLGCGISYIDLEVRTESDWVLLENKTGTGLGTRLDRETGEEVGQLAKYSQVLDHAPVPEANRHIGMLVWAPQPRPQSAYFRGARYWWDLYQALASAPATKDGYADRLRTELLSFFRFLELDPIAPLRRDDLAQVSLVQRLLARTVSMAVQEGAELLHPRPATTGAYLFERATAEGRESWSFGFSGGELFAHVSNEGYRQVALPEGFLSANDAEDQVRALAAILCALPTAPRDASRAKLPELDFLEGFGDVRPAIEALFETAREIDWSLKIGSAEAVLQRRDRGPQDVVLYLSAAYSWGPYARIWCPSEALRDQLARALGTAHGTENVKAQGESVKVFLRPETPVGGLISALEALVPSP
jgi:hypothetical protein